VLCRDEISQHTWELSVSRFETPPPENSLFILVARDITPVVELQESVMKSQSMSAMGALVAGVAHEVRNPLFAISATLDAFDLRFRDQDAYKKYAQALRMQLDRMNDLMHDLLDYGKPAVYVIRDVPLEEVVGEAIRICSDHAARRSVRLSYGEEKALPAVRVDRSRTVQVFVNLIENAIEHSPPGGVRIRAERSDDERTIRCSIEDEGPGFRPDDLPRVFEPFFTRRQGGTGLGLSIVRRIVTEQGGTVIPSNRPGAGACVTLTFPCAVGDAVAPAREATS
jgi:signal transduction histidine kinase